MPDDKAESTQAIEIRPLPAAASAERAVMESVTALINEVYAVAEDGLWVDGAARTTTGEVAELTRSGQITIAVLDGRIVGCVRGQRLDGARGEFGMLAADPSHRSAGIGRELVRFAEDKCRDDGLAIMQLELLVPRN